MTLYVSLFGFLSNIRIATFLNIHPFFGINNIYGGVRFGIINGYIAALPILGKAGLKTLDRNNQHC